MPVSSASYRYSFSVGWIGRFTNVSILVPICLPISSLREAVLRFLGPDLRLEVVVQVLRLLFEEHIVCPRLLLLPPPPDTSRLSKMVLLTLVLFFDFTFQLPDAVEHILIHGCLALPSYPPFGFGCHGEALHAMTDVIDRTGRRCPLIRWFFSLACQVRVLGLMVVILGMDDRLFVFLSIILGVHDRM